MQDDYLIHVDGNKWLVGFEAGSPRYLAERPRYGVSLQNALMWTKELLQREHTQAVCLSRISYEAI